MERADIRQHGRASLYVHAAQPPYHPGHHEERWGVRECRRHHHVSHPGARLAPLHHPVAWPAVHRVPRADRVFRACACGHVLRDDVGELGLGSVSSAAGMLQAPLRRLLQPRMAAQSVLQLRAPDSLADPHAIHDVHGETERPGRAVLSAGHLRTDGSLTSAPGGSHALHARRQRHEAAGHLGVFLFPPRFLLRSHLYCADSLGTGAHQAEALPFDVSVRRESKG